jgi:predicted enzyme related to lactoylglutathione lyase
MNNDEPRVTGIGGIFFKSQDPDKTKSWYRDNLGLDTDQWGTNFEWFQENNASKKGFTQWSPSNNTAKHFEPSKKEYMINYRVVHIEKLVDRLRNNGVEILDDIVSYPYGKFVHVMDEDGNKIELWEPNDTEYDKIVEGRTK